MFLVFHLAESTCAQQKHSLRVEEMQHADWLICLVGIQYGGITRNLLRDKLREICFSKFNLDSTLSNNFLQPATNVFVARQVDPAR